MEWNKNEQESIVLDIGSLVVKCGISGESIPRKLFCWTLPKRKSTIIGNVIYKESVKFQLYHS